MGIKTYIVRLLQNIIDKILTRLWTTFGTAEKKQPCSISFKILLLMSDIKLDLCVLQSSS